MTVSYFEDIIRRPERFSPNVLHVKQAFDCPADEIPPQRMLPGEAHPQGDNDKILIHVRNNDGTSFCLIVFFWYLFERFGDNVDANCSHAIGK